MKKIDNMKPDARVRYTKAVIQDSFFELLKKKPVDKITVTELCQLAQINRATFYCHYDDCFDLLRCIEDEFLGQFFKSGMSGSPDAYREPKALVSAIYDTITNNIEICDALIFNVKAPTLLTRMIDSARVFTADKWRQSLTSLSEKEQDMLFTHLSTGLASIMYSYYKTTSREELIDFMVRVATNCLAPYIKQL